MLDTDTKRRINTCRDILVGKVPDPKSQVEQITIALIYKFMDDMDLEAEEMEFDRKFFTGEYERYRWSKLLAPGVSGQEMLNLYSEALLKMVENEGLPELFRNIFRNAYLPYRDPETLRSFLREINGFTYDHSERLGDAFEYLLSVLGSQGDAGQFRTPRHIIDFMVEIIDPKKDEVILDPACGTAGFLISSYKHILKANSTVQDGNGGNGAEVDAAEATLDSPLRYSGDLLTTDDRERLANNIKGYDISPDMVRLSLVNLYLHGFLDPKVEEYDTLTSEDKWGETADVIFANPPFMSPKGGIKPHTKFSIASKRSEVLFVDYIAEHLTPKGRAAIVVPEGIIFQSQSAYVELRKTLVEKYLAAVVSLPAGVFNPYSGVKTSILILDSAVAKASDEVAFFKIENDGFGLGAQRKAVKGTQLPQAKAELTAWLNEQRSGGEMELPSSLGFTVERSRIGEDGQFSLSGERYREAQARASAFPVVTIGEVAAVRMGETLIKSDLTGDGRPIYSADSGTKPWAFSSNTKLSFGPNTVVIGARGTIGSVKFPESDDFTCTQTTIAITADEAKVLPAYLYRFLRLFDFKGITEGVGIPMITVKNVNAIEIPVPPLDVQKEIVAEIEGYQKVIDGARAVVDNYRPQIPHDPAWPQEDLGSLCKISSGGTPSKANEAYWSGDIPWVSAKDLKVDEIYDAALHISTTAVDETATQLAPVGALLILVRGMGLANGVPVGEVMVSCAFNQDLKALLPDTDLLVPRYLAHALRQQQTYFRRVMETAAHGTLKLDSEALKQTKIPLPPLEIQQAIVAEIEAEQKLVNGNRELIQRFEKKIEATIARIWGADEETMAT